jgi:CxxC motif-containing protein (DUF1111 family)
VNQQFKESQASVEQLYPIVPGGIRVVSGCSTQVADFNPVHYDSINTPPLFGLILIEREISDWALIGNGAGRGFNRFSRDLEGDFATTKVGRLRVLAGNRIGRFGWKGQFATLEEFVAAACAVELGLSNPLRSQDLPRQHRPDPNAGFDLDHEQLRALVAFVANLPRPIQILPEEPRALALVKRGEELFSSAGCADCHTPNLGSVEGVYTDLRLYDLEPPKSSGYSTTVPEVPLPLHEPDLAEWKTPPLWGVADSAPYFHDGASLTLDSAILRHDGAAKRSRENLRKAEDRQAVIAFLMTLRAPQVTVANGNATQLAATH